MEESLRREVGKVVASARATLEELAEEGVDAGETAGDHSDRNGNGCSEQESAEDSAETGEGATHEGAFEPERLEGTGSLLEAGEGVGAEDSFIAFSSGEDVPDQDDHQEAGETEEEVRPGSIRHQLDNAATVNDTPLMAIDPFSTR